MLSWLPDRWSLRSSFFVEFLNIMSALILTNVLCYPPSLFLCVLGIFGRGVIGSIHWYLAYFPTSYRFFLYAEIQLCNCSQLTSLTACVSTSEAPSYSGYFDTTSPLPKLGLITFSDDLSQRRLLALSLRQFRFDLAFTPLPQRRLKIESNNRR